MDHRHFHHARKAHEQSDTLPEQANVYVPPRPLAQISDHRTMDIKAIRIAAEIDPRQAKTIVRMQAPVRRRRGLVLFALGSVIVVALLGAAAYVTVVGPQSLPLTPEPAAAPRAPSPPVEIQTAPVVPRAAEREPPSAPTEPATVAPPVTTPEATGTARSGSRPGQHATPHKTRVNQEPWLE